MFDHMTPSRESPVFQLVRTNHEEAEKGHTRLREDLTAVEERMRLAENALKEQAFSLKLLQAAPQELSRIRLSPSTVAAILIAAGGIIANEVRLVSSVEAKLAHLEEASQARDRLQEERATSQRSATEAIGKRQELLQIKFDELRDQVLGRRSR